MTDFAYVGSELELFASATNWKAYWSSQLQPYVGQRVFDVGAGLGANVRVLFQPGASWLCIEPDADLARGAAATVAELGLSAQCKVFNGTLADLDPAEQADTIIYIDVIEHIEDDRAELERARRRLRPGGRLIVLTPAHQWLFSPFDTAVGHCRRYTTRSLAAVVPRDLQLERLRYLDSAGLLASGANKLVLRSGSPSPAQIGVWDRLLVPPSRLLDPLFGYRLGKTVIGVWRAPGG